MKKSDENIAGFFRWTTQANPLSINHIYNFSCVYPVKLKNLKANHNLWCLYVGALELCISRKVKKSESKSQRAFIVNIIVMSCVYPVKLKNLKANHNPMGHNRKTFLLCISRKVKKSESKSQLLTQIGNGNFVVYIP